MKKYLIKHDGKALNAVIELPASKSISNRLLIINALAQNKFDIKNLAASDDTQKMIAALKLEDSKVNVGAAGTTSRFLTAILSITEGEWEISGTERLHQRPIKALVDALKSLGASIEYLGTEGCLPLRIIGKELKGGKVTIKGDISSQFITALLLIAPEFPEGLEMEFSTNLVSVPYIKMTLALMEQCGIKYNWSDQKITVQSGIYKSEEVRVESDWSAASYLYSIAALANVVDDEIILKGLDKKSLQGDSVIFYLFEKLGIESKYYGSNLFLKKIPLAKHYIEIDFEDFPDMAQTIIVVCAALNVKGVFTGLSTLRVKETDRIAAIQKELQKLGADILVDGDTIELKGGIDRNSKNVEIETYEDHRMAMAFAPLALILPNIIIENPKVVEKSYPTFWKDLKKLNFGMEEIG